MTKVPFNDEQKAKEWEPIDEIDSGMLKIDNLLQL